MFENGKLLLLVSRFSHVLDIRAIKEFKLEVIFSRFHLRVLLLLLTKLVMDRFKDRVISSKNFLLVGIEFDEKIFLHVAYLRQLYQTDLEGERGFRVFYSITYSSSYIQLREDLLPADILAFQNGHLERVDHKET